jgi:UDP-N-acetylglucosamine acyltransferase
LYNSSLNNTDALNKIIAEIPDSEEKSIVVDFVKSSDRGIVKGK